MRDILIIGAACLIALGVGIWLYTSDGSSVVVPQAPFIVLDAGNASGSITERTNYRIQNQDQLDQLWLLVHGTGAPTTVDFSKSDVLAVFDGTHTTGGYGIEVTDVMEANGKEMVSITHTVPGSSCLTNQMITSPFQIIVVPKSSLALSHTDVTNIKECN